MASLYTLFDDLSTRRAEEAAGLFEPARAAAGQAIATEGEVNDAMLFVERGEVVVHAGGFEVARMGPGSIIGEIGLFTHAVRTATVIAAVDTQLQILSRRAFAHLRNAGNPVAARIERRAVDQLSGRMRRLVADIVEVAGKTPSVLQEARRTTEYSGHPIQLPIQRTQAALSAATSFYGATPQALQTIAQKVDARTYNAGDTLSADGRDDGPLYILAHGQVDCVAPVGRAKQVRVATLEAGEVFNLLHHVDEQARPVAYVARDGVSVLAIHQKDVFGLLRGGGPASSTLRIAIIRSMADRVNQANATFSLTRLMQPG